jgi:hypothetical protein
MRPEPGTPVHAVAASAVTGTAGGNNGITWTATVAGVGGNSLTRTIVIDSTTDRTQLTAVKTGNDIVVTSGDKRRMIVTGTLTDGTNPVVFPALFFDDGAVIDTWTDADAEAPNYVIFGEPGDWKVAFIFESVLFNAYLSSDEVATPDLVTTWAAQSPATGTPTVTAAIATAAQVITAVNAASLGVTLTNTGASNGTVAVAASTLALFSGGVAATEGSKGDQLIDGNFLYTATADVSATSTSGWEKSAVAAL